MALASMAYGIERMLAQAIPTQNIEANSNLAAAKNATEISPSAPITRQVVWMPLALNFLTSKSKRKANRKATPL